MPPGVGYTNVMAPGSPRPRKPRKRSLDDQYQDLSQDVEGYDPRGAFEESARAQFESIRTPLAEAIESLRGQQVGSGRLNTGFGNEDQDRLVRGAYEDLNRAIASRAYLLPQYELQQFGLRGDLVSGALDRRTLEENARRQSRSQWLSSLLQAGGFVLGNAVAPGAGGFVGAAAGRAAGGYGGGGF